MQESREDDRPELRRDQSGSSGQIPFGQRLLTLMRRSRTEPVPELLRDLFSFDTEDPAFWRSRIEGLRREVTRFANDRAAYAIAFPAGPRRPSGGAGGGRFVSPEA